MKSKRIPFSLFFSSILLTSCAAAPQEVAPTRPGSTPQTTGAAPSATKASIAVGHDSAPAAAGQSSESSAGPVKWSAPSRWESKPPSGMRAATYVIPAAQGDPEGAECAVFLNIQGGVDANIKRWIGQFEQPDGSSSEAKAKQKK